jgi:hypothetical protein
MISDIDKYSLMELRKKASRCLANIPELERGPSGLRDYVSTTSKAIECLTDYVRELHSALLRIDEDKK